MKEISTLFFYLLSLLGKSNLIRKTSQNCFLFKIIYYLLIGSLIYLDYLKQEVLSEISSEEIFEDVILPVELNTRILSLANSSKTVRQNNAPYSLLVNIFKCLKDLDKFIL